MSNEKWSKKISTEVHPLPHHAILLTSVSEPACIRSLELVVISDYDSRYVHSIRWQGGLYRVQNRRHGYNSIYAATNGIAVRGTSMNPLVGPKSSACPWCAIVCPFTVRFFIGALQGLCSTALEPGGESSEGGGDGYDSVGDATCWSAVFTAGVAALCAGGGCGEMCMCRLGWA